MIVPSFRITQDEEYVFVHINVPYVRVGAAEMVCDGMEFSFYCKPYLLKLKFPHPLDGTDEERCRATHDPSEAHGTLVAHLPKVTPGLHFPDLDLTTKLMQLKGRPQASKVTGIAMGSSSGTTPAIQVISSTDTTDTSTKQPDLNDLEDEVPLETEDDLLLRLRPDVKYGFNYRYSRILGRFQEELADVLELPDPDQTPECQRRSMRLRIENNLFDPARYLGDLCGGDEDPVFCAAMTFQPFWVHYWDHWQAAVKMSKTAADAGISEDDIASKAVIKDAAFEHSSGGGGFSEEDRICMARDLGHREYLISAEEQKTILLGLIDLLFVYSFDVRCTENEKTVESAHNITRLSGLLSWMDGYREKTDSCHTVICSLMRRVCIYPYMRHWKLGRKVLSDVARILYLGKRCILKCLLGVRSAFHTTDTHYMLNKVIIDDYCCWIQSVNDDEIQEFAREFNMTKTAFEKSGDGNNGKHMVGLQLPDVEQWMYARQQGATESETESSSSSNSSSSSSSDDDNDDRVDSSDSEDVSEDDEDVEEEFIPAQFCAANRDAATALTPLAAPIKDEGEICTNEEKGTLTELLSGMAMTSPPGVPTLDTASASVLPLDTASAASRPLVEELPPLPPSQSK